MLPRFLNNPTTLYIQRTQYAKECVCNIYVFGIHKIYNIDLRWSFLIHIPHEYVHICTVQIATKVLFLSLSLSIFLWPAGSAFAIHSTGKLCTVWSRMVEKSGVRDDEITIVNNRGRKKQRQWQQQQQKESVYDRTFRFHHFSATQQVTFQKRVEMETMYISKFAHHSKWLQRI